jgi:hypothetical protein
VDSVGKRHLLIPLLPGEAARTVTSGRAVELRRIAFDDGTQFLSVVCTRPELHEVFTQFCYELASSVELATSPAREAFDSYLRWRALLADSSAQTLLSEQRLVGLLGELVMLEDLLRLGAASGLDFWTGPSGAVHDFRLAHRAIEVKGTLVREGRRISISSVDQLQAPDGSDLLLRHLRFQRDPSGFTLQELAGKVLAAGAEHGALRDALGGIGVDLDRLDEYLERYSVDDSRYYDVSSVGFPRIVRSSFAGGDVPSGTLNLEYSIDLTNAPPHPLAENQVQETIANFAQESSHEVDS